MAIKSGKVFDLHFEIGLSNTGDFYAKTVLKPPHGVMFHAVGATPASALAKVALDMENSSMWANIATDPTISSFPFNVAAKPVIKVDPNAPKQRPSDIHNIPHPDCTSVCQSFDLFGDVKCQNICAHRKGI